MVTALSVFWPNQAPPQSVNTTGGFLRHRHRLWSENILSGEGVSLDDSDTPQAPLPFGISICTLHFDIPGRGLPFMTFLTPLHSILIIPFVISHCREGSFRLCHFNPRPPSLLVFSFCHFNTREGSCRFFSTICGTLRNLIKRQRKNKKIYRSH